MLRLTNCYENGLAARLAESYKRHATARVSDENEIFRQQMIDLDLQQFWWLTQERNESQK